MDENYQAKKSRMRLRKTTLLFIAAAVCAVSAAGAAGFFFWKYMQIKNDPKVATAAAQNQTKRIVSEVGKLYKLPASEQPTVASI